MKAQFFKLPLILLVMVLTVVSCNKEEINLKSPQNAEVDFRLGDEFSSQIIPGRYIVVLNDDAVAAEFEGRRPSFAEARQIVAGTAGDLMRRNGLAADRVGATYGSTIRGFAASLSQAEVAKISDDQAVKYIEPDWTISIQPSANGKPPWAGGGNDGGGSTGQETPWGITRVGGGADGTGLRAWILDTGIDIDHPDLNVNPDLGKSFITRGKDVDNVDDGHGHGTHVAGTIAAINNEKGVIGVAAGATVIPVKVLDHRGSGTYSGVIAGVDFVGANGTNGDVANMSLGGPVSQALDDAVVAASQNGIKFALAAGNESDDANNHSPARANGPNIYTVSAMDANDVFAYFSNYGNPPVDYCEPGVSIKSTWKDGGYNTISGTSMAAPHMAGILLLGNFGTDGNVIGDPDGNADPIGVH